MNLLKPFSAAIIGLSMAVSVQASVITGTITLGYGDDLPVELSSSVGDGSNQVEFTFLLANGWTEGLISERSHKGYFRGSDAEFSDSDVAYAAGVTHISQITDASSLVFANSLIGPYCDATCAANGVGDFIVSRNTISGHYGVLRIEEITDESWSDGFVTHHEATLFGTWWFQTDGTGNFAMPVPEPSTYLLFGIGLLTVFGYRLRRA